MHSPFNLKLTQEMQRKTEKGKSPAKSTVRPRKQTVRREKSKKVEDEPPTLLQRSQETQYSHRCVSLSFNKTMKVVDLPPTVVKLIGRTPFSHFLDLPVCKIHGLELNKLLNQKLDDNNFKLGRTVLQFQVSDVASILHLRNEGLEIRVKRRRPPTSTIELMFISETKIRKWYIEKILKSIRDGEMVVDDTTMAHLWMSLLFSTFLIPDSSGGFDPSILEYIVDIDGIGRYNWAAYVYNVIMNSLDTVKTYCLGCAWALMVWAYQQNPNLVPSDPDDGILFRQWKKIPPNLNNIVTCENVKGSSLSGFSLRMPRLVEELATIKQENDRLKCRVVELEEENKSLRKQLDQKIATASSSKKKEKEDDEQVKEQSSAPDEPIRSSMVKRIKMGARKRNIVRQGDIEVYTKKRTKNFPGKRALTDTECERIDHFLSNINYFGPQKFEINNARCFGTDINDLIMGKCTSSRIIDVYMEIIKRNYNTSGAKGVYFMDSFASRYIIGDTDCSEGTRRSNIHKLETSFAEVLSDVTSCRKILMPVHAEFHWHLLEMDFQGKAFRDYNSLRKRRNDGEVGRMQDWLSLFDHVKKLSLLFHEWDLDFVQSFPQQKDDSLDCGIFLLKAMEILSMDQQIDFKQKDVSRIRGEMAVEILKSSVRG